MNEVCSKDSALSPELEHDVIINLTSPSEDKFYPYKFKLPRASTKQYPRKNKYLYKMAKSLIIDTTNTDTWHSPNATSDCYMYKSLRVSSRSAKIMNALSSAHNSFRQDFIKIKKSLNFDLTPSPKGSSSYDENSISSISTDTSSSVLNSSSIESTDSNVPVTSMESIDENQNQTPQQNRKSSNRIGIKENICIQPRTFHIMSLLEKGQKEGTDKNHGSLFSSLSPFIGSKLNRVITASIPRNLSQEFNRELDDRPHTPENMINVIPESISAIKKSHKKEKLYPHEELLSTQQMDVFVKNDNLNTTTESSETNMVAVNSCNATSENEFQKKNRNIKRTLVYNDECRDTELDHNVLQKITSTKNDSLESGLDQIESDVTQDINSNDESHDEDMQVSTCLIDHNDEEENHSNENVCNEEVSQLLLRKESSGVSNVTNENKTTSPESSSSISQDTNEVVTPENNMNMFKHVLTESIKKSHKKMKHGNRKMLFKDSHKKIGLAKSEISFEGIYNIDQDIESQTADAIHTSSSQNSEFDRPSTPENINSSRLLLLDFNSVKKSHKKDKRSKRTSNFVECHDYEYRKRNNDSLRRSRHEEEIYKTLRRNESLELKKSPSMSPKKKKSASTPLQSSTPKFPDPFVSSECKDISDEFKIFTPIKKRSISIAVTNVSTGEMSQEDVSTQATSKEIDCSRCVTPVARRFKELRKNEDLTSQCDNTRRSETDVSVLKATDTESLKDKNGRSTPINMSTKELLCNIDSIKKSHKKNKHNHSKRPFLKKKQSYIEKCGHINFANDENMLEEPTILSLKHINEHYAEKEMCIIMQEKEKNRSYKEIYDDPDNPQPSTSREADNIKNIKNVIKSKFLNTTPPNSLSAINLMKLVQTTSIKKSHKKERDINAQTKYILMSQEHELSDDGSIFDEEEKLDFIKNDSIAQDNDNIIDK